MTTQPFAKGIFTLGILALALVGISKALPAGKKLLMVGGKKPKEKVEEEPPPPPPAPMPKNQD